MQNETNHPTSTITHQIATDMEKTFDDLKIKVYDENNKGLRISSIELDTLTQKEFATSFSKPLARGERVTYFLEYEVEEPQRYFENMFFAKCENFDLVLEFPKNTGKPGIQVDPVFYEVNSEKGTKEPSQARHDREEEDGIVRMRRSISDVSKGRCVRLEW